MPGSWLWIPVVRIWPNQSSQCRGLLVTLSRKACGRKPEPGRELRRAGAPGPEEHLLRVSTSHSANVADLWEEGVTSRSKRQT